MIDNKGMTVKELIEFLKTCPEDAEVWHWDAYHDVDIPVDKKKNVRYNNQDHRVEIW